MSVDLAARLAKHIGKLTGVTGLSEVYDCLTCGLFNLYYDAGVDGYVPSDTD